MCSLRKAQRREQVVYFCFYIQEQMWNRPQGRTKEFMGSRIEKPMCINKKLDCETVTQLNVRKKRLPWYLTKRKAKLAQLIVPGASVSSRKAQIRIRESIVHFCLIQHKIDYNGFYKQEHMWNRSQGRAKEFIQCVLSINKKLDCKTVRQFNLNVRKKHHLWLLWYLTNMKKHFIIADNIKEFSKDRKMNTKETHKIAESNNNLWH